MAEESPSKLKSTESILNNLYERALNSAHKVTTSHIHSEMMEPDHIESNHRQKLISSLRKEKQRISSISNFSNQDKLGFNAEKLTLRTEPHESSEIHVHDQHCCMRENIGIKQKLKKMEQNQFLMESYKEEVQYLKKMMFLQSEEIQKLRRVIRAQGRELHSLEPVQRSENLQEGEWVQVKKKPMRKSSMKTDKKKKNLF